MKVAIYIRTSTDEQNPENQISDCRSIVKPSWGEVEVYQDKQSAWKDNKERENFNKLINDIKLKRISNLVVWDLDRIYRNRSKLLGFFELCKVKDCAIWSFRQGFINEIQSITLPNGFEFIKEMMINNFLQFLGWIAEDESNKKSDRVRAAIRIRDDGAYSYKGNKWGRKSLSTQKVNQIKDLSINNKMSIRAIAKEVKCSIGAVHKVLSNLEPQKSASESSVHN